MTDPNQIATQWLSFDDKRRTALLGKMSPDQKRNLRIALEQHHSTSYTPPPGEKQPGFFSRTLQGLGLPSSFEELKALPGPKEAVKPFGEYSGYGILKNMATGYANTLLKTSRNATVEERDAINNIRAGGPIGANLGKAALGELGFWVGGVMSPVGGGSVMAFGEDIGSKNKSGAAGDATAVLLNALLMKSGRPRSAGAKVDAIAYAGDLKRGVDDLKTVLPDIERAAGKKPPENIGGLLDSVNKAKDNMNMQSGLAMKPIKGQQLVPIGISNRIRSRITPDMVQTAEGMRAEAAFKDAATDFEKPWTFEQLDSLRMRWGPELEGYYNMSRAERSSFLKAHPEVAIQLEVVQGIQDIVYPAMDKAAGKPAGFFKALKQRQSTLIELQKNLETQADELATKSSALRGAPRFDQRNLSVYAAGTKGAHPGFSLHRLHNVISRTNPEAMANKQLLKAFTGRPISRAAIRSYPVRQMILGNEPKKKPAEQLRDLNRITSSNPALPVGEAQ